METASPIVAESPVLSDVMFGSKCNCTAASGFGAPPGCAGVVIAAGAVNSAALLLRSANDKHPRGLANGSDVVGRHYMRHNNVALMGLSREPNPTRFQKTLALHDWYAKADDWNYPLGGIQMLGKSDAEQIRAKSEAYCRTAPGFKPIKQYQSEIARKMGLQPT